MAVLDPNEIMFRAFEPKVQNRFIMYVDSIPSFMIKNVTAPSFTDEEVKLDHNYDRRGTHVFRCGRFSYKFYLHLHFSEQIDFKIFVRLP